MARLSFRCDQDLIDRVDEIRGQIPRETFLRGMVQSVTRRWPAGSVATVASDEVSEEMAKALSGEVVAVPGSGVSRADAFRRATQR